MGWMFYAKKLTQTVESYKKVFKKNDVDVQTVLADLGSIAPIDPTAKLRKPYNNNEVYIMIGRRQVVSHILGKMNMTEEELNRIIKNAQMKEIQQQQQNGL